MKSKELFNYIFIGVFFSFLPLFLIVGVLSLFNIIPLDLNDSKIYGIKALFIAFIYSLLMTLVWTFFTWLMLLYGHFIYNLLFKKNQDVYPKQQNKGGHGINDQSGDAAKKAE